MRVQLKLFVATARNYLYSAYKSECVSVLKTKLDIFFAPVLAFLFSVLFFFNFKSRTAYIPTIRFKRTKRVCRYATQSLFGVLPIFNLV
jgi:hypothetical protein